MTSKPSTGDGAGGSGAPRARRPAGDAGGGAGIDPDDRHRLIDLRDRLLGDHPGSDADRIEQALTQSWERTADARVRGYRLILAERAARAVLREESSRQ